MMKIILKIIVGILVLLSIPFIVALFMEKEYAVHREITVNRPVNEVFDYLKHLKNQNQFNVWDKMDPEMKKTYKGTDGTVGFVSAWESKLDSVGVGEKKILKIQNNKRIDIAIQFKEPFESNDFAYFTTKSIDSATTQIVWGFNGKFDYPMNLMQLFIDMDKELGKDLEKGLYSIKKIVEAKNTLNELPKN